MEDILKEKLDKVLRCAFESLTGAKIIVDENGIILYASKFHYEYLGYTKEEELIGQDVRKVIPGTRMHVVLETETPEYGYIFRFIHRKTKEVVPVVCNRAPIYDEQGTLVGAMSETLFPHGMETVLSLAKEVEKIRQHQMDASLVDEIHKMESYVIGDSEQIRELRSMISQVANFPLPVLITGETGTGKEVFASAIHKFSERASKNFVKINCAAIPSELLESELFGYAPGAFSGALHGGKTGKFEYAQQGTILLDEIGDMPYPLQAKLLRAIQEKEFEKVGGLHTIPFNARIICTTNQNITKLVEEQRFRQDLYYRINVIELRIPPLRDRKEDIQPLCRHFIDQINRENGLSVVDITPEALDLLIRHNWPGNVRELRHDIERACFLAGAGMLEKTHFRQLQERMSELSAVPTAGSDAPADDGEIMTLANARAYGEMKEIIRALEATSGNKKKASELLGVDRAFLHRKIKEYGLET